jgi:hypothetical protein
MVLFRFAPGQVRFLAGTAHLVLTPGTAGTGRIARDGRLRRDEQAAERGAQGDRHRMVDLAQVAVGGSHIAPARGVFRRIRQRAGKPRLPGEHMADEVSAATDSPPPSASRAFRKHAAERSGADSATSAILASQPSGPVIGSQRSACFVGQCGGIVVHSPTVSKTRVPRS